jgi:predicted nuclease with TOPRIM domain
MAEDIHAHIEELVAEEHRLWELESSGSSVEADRERLAHIKVELDRYWDLLRRRRAAKALGVDEESVGLRSEETVENYLQ